MAEIELNSDPESTWGASAAYREAWNKEYGGVPAGNAPKADWVARAVAVGASEEEAEAMTVTELKNAYGADYVPPAATAPAATNYGGAPAADTAGGGSPAAGGGVNSGTAEGTPATSSSPATGMKGK